MLFLCNGSAENHSNRMLDMVILWDSVPLSCKLDRTLSCIALGSYFNIRIFLYLARDYVTACIVSKVMVVSSLLAHFAVNAFSY